MSTEQFTRLRPELVEKITEEKTEQGKYESLVGTWTEEGMREELRIIQKGISEGGEANENEAMRMAV